MILKCSNWQKNENIDQNNVYQKCLKKGFNLEIHPKNYQNEPNMLKLTTKMKILT